MSATTIAVATATETVDPPGSRSPHAAVPVSEAIFARNSGVTPGHFHLCSQAWANSRSARKNPEFGQFWCLDTQFSREVHISSKRTACSPQSRHDFVFPKPFREWGKFPED